MYKEKCKLYKINKISKKITKVKNCHHHQLFIMLTHFRVENLLRLRNSLINNINLT